MIGAIESGVVARLKAASDAGVLGYKYRQVDSLPVMQDDELVRRAAQFPGAWVIFAGAKAVKQLSSGALQQGSFWVLVGAKNMRNDRATRQGGSDEEVGAYQMVLDAAGLMVGQSLGLGIRGFNLGAIAPLYPSQSDKARGLSLFGVELVTDFAVLPRAAAVPDIGDFASFHVNWDLPAHGEVDADPEAPDVQLPADPKAQTTSHIILETQS